MIENIKGFLFDLDGVLCIDDKPIHDSVELINTLQSIQIPFRILTNYTTLSRRNLYDKLTSLGFNVSKDHIISAAYAGVLRLRKLNNPKCQFILNDNVIEDYNEFILDSISPEYIIIGDLDDKWSFEIINDIFKKVINGSKIIALHKGRYFEVSDGLQIDSGAFIQAIEYATSTHSEVIGKPERTFFQLAIDDIGVLPKHLMMIGDDIINDIGGAKEMGIKSTLVKTGKFRKDIVNSVQIKPDYIIDSASDLLSYFR